MTDTEGNSFHVRVLVGMVVGLAIGNLLRGVARVISAQGHRPVHWVRMAWASSGPGTRRSTAPSPSSRSRSSYSGSRG